MILTRGVPIALSMVPSELTLRDSMFTPLVGISLFTAFLLISFSKLLDSNIFSSLLISNIKIQGLQNYIRESHPLNKGGSILLIANYFISFSIVLYMISGYGNIELNNELILVGIIPIALMLWSLGSMNIIALVTGERSVFYEPIAFKMVGMQLLGIFYFITALVLSLHSFGESVFLSIVIWGFIVETIFRLLKSVIVVYLHGVSWYYIILYFCTLEILPLFVAYYVLLRDFNW